MTSDFYNVLFNLLFGLLFQADPVNSVREIGFWATVGLIFTALIVWAIRQLFSYFTTRLDKKDEQISKLMDERHHDLLRLEGVLTNQAQAHRDMAREQTAGFKSVADTLQALANEVRKQK